MGGAFFVAGGDGLIEGGTIKGGGLVWLALGVEGCRQIVERSQVNGLDSQGGSVMLDRFVDVALLKQRPGQVVVDVGVVGLEFQ